MFTVKTPIIPSNSIYKIGGVAVLAALLSGVVDICLSFLPAGVVPDPGKGTVLDWFTLLQQDWFMGLRGLGFLNIISTTLIVLVFAALYTAISQAAPHQQENRVYAALAVILLVMGATIYIANNPALPMLRLSGQYTSAVSESEKAMLAASGQNLLARAEDFTPGSFMGFFFTEVASILMVLVMSRSGLFSKPTMWLGIMGFTLLLVFSIWSTFIPVFYDAAMMIAMLGGLFSLAWYFLVGHRLFQFGGNSL